MSLIVGLFVGTLLALGLLAVTDEYAHPNDVTVGWALIAASSFLSVAYCIFIVAITRKDRS